MKFQIVFLVITAVTVLSGCAATAIAVFGDTHNNAGQRAIAEKLAQIAVVGATALAALLGRDIGSAS